jgi:hypothetical protein
MKFYKNNNVLNHLHFKSLNLILLMKYSIMKLNNVQKKPIKKDVKQPNEHEIIFIVNHHN